MAYAEKTTVTVDRSQAEIRKILSKYNAQGFAFGERENLAMLQFEMAGRRIKFLLPLPSKPHPSSSGVAFKQYDQKCRSRWRSLALAIKAKLECVESGIATLEQEFLAHIMLPNGATVGDVMGPQIEASYKNGNMPPLLGYTS